MKQDCYICNILPDAIINYFLTFGTASWISFVVAFLGLVIVFIGISNMVRWERITVIIIGVMIFILSVVGIHYSGDTIFVVTNYKKIERPNGSWEIYFDLTPKGKKGSIPLIEICCNTNNDARFGGFDFNIEGDKESYLWTGRTEDNSFCIKRIGIKSTIINVYLSTNKKPEMHCTIYPGIKWKQK